MKSATEKVLLFLRLELYNKDLIEVLPFDLIGEAAAAFLR